MKFYPFAGIFPWVPWIQAVNQFNNYLINSDMPTVLAVGTVDTNYGVLMSLYDSLKAEGANINLVLAVGIGHVEDFSEFGNTMVTCMKYLTSPKTITASKIDNVVMLNSDQAKEITFDISNPDAKELQFKTISRTVNSFTLSPVSYNSSTGKATFTITPVAGKSGSAKVIVEVSEKNGAAITQTVFNLKVDKNTASSSVGAIKDRLIVSPNPANDYITIECKNRITGFEIFNFTGKKVLAGDVSESKARIDVSSLPKGNYFLITSEGYEPVRFCLQ
jgi:hypothetical protein